jgi:hypothetical protein
MNSGSDHSSEIQLTRVSNSLETSSLKGPGKI